MPIIINGIDASYTVVEGDWGLGKGMHVQPTVYGGRYVDYEPHVGHYYPSAGHVPGYGRLEIEPPANRKLPQPAESYHESWSAQSAPPPKMQPEVPLYPPPVIVAPQNDEHGHAARAHEPAAKTLAAKAKGSLMKKGLPQYKASATESTATTNRSTGKKQIHRRE